MKNIKLKLIIIPFIILSGIIMSAYSVKAQTAEPCLKMIVSVILRNPNGDFIPNANFEIYEQAEDVNGSPKPGKKIASGKIDQYLGRGTVSFANDNNDFAIKAWTAATAKAPFWFYNDLHLACGGETEISQYLSAIDFVLRDTEGNLRKNTAFSVYSQRLDADLKPIKEKDSLIGTFNTGETGEVINYLPSGSRTVNSYGSDYYIFESSGKNGGTFTLYNIAVSDYNATEVDYVFSDFKLELKDSSGLTFPGNTKIEVYKQIIEDANNNKAVGDFIKDIFTDDQGIAVLEYPVGNYAARIKGSNDNYQYFWDLAINDQKREIYELTSSESWDPGQGACTADSLVTVFTRDLGGEIIPGLKFEIYERILDANKKPMAGSKLSGGVIDATGKAVIKINPDSRKKYALKIYDKSDKAGDFWFFDEMQFKCGENKEITKNIPTTTVILRDGNGQLKKNQTFSIYIQKSDVDENPIAQKSDLVGSFTTNEQGSIRIFLAPDHPYDSSKRGLYVFSAVSEGGQFNEYYIGIEEGNDYKLEYIFSDIIIEIKDAAGRMLSNEAVNFYEQMNKNGKNELGKKIKSLKTGTDGKIRLEYPAGRYALATKDDLNQDNILWDITIKNRVRVNQTVTANLTRVTAKNSAGTKSSAGSINIYALADDGSGNFVVSKKIKSLKTTLSGILELSLMPNPYLFTFIYGKMEYGKVLYTENGKLQTVTIELKPENAIMAGKKFKLAKPITLGSISERLRGYILLQVEGRGEAWYVNPNDGKRYYMPDGEIAYEMMRKFGLGITDDNLKKIIIGADDRLGQFDYDGDGLPDDTENTIGTDMYNRDSDNDGFIDGEETLNGYDPLGSGKLGIDKNLSEAQKGKILLQVEANGEAWYVNPRDGRRFYMKDGDSAYEIMRFLSLGIKNADLEKIEIGILSN